MLRRFLNAINWRHPLLESLKFRGTGVACVLLDPDILRPFLEPASAAVLSPRLRELAGKRRIDSISRAVEAVAVSKPAAVKIGLADWFANS